MLFSPCLVAVSGKARQGKAGGGAAHAASCAAEFQNEKPAAHINAGVGWPTHVLFCCRYGSVKKMLRAACDASGAQMVTTTVSFPIRCDCCDLQLPQSLVHSVFHVCL